MVILVIIWQWKKIKAMFTKDPVFSGDISKMLYDHAVKKGMPKNISTFLVGQAKFESGNYKSNHAVNSKNLFGYLWTKGNKNAIGKGGQLSNGGYVAKYASYTDSLQDVIDWIGRRQRQNRMPKDLSAMDYRTYAEYLFKNKYYERYKNLTDQQTIDAYANGIKAGMSGI